MEAESSAAQNFPRKSLDPMRLFFTHRRSLVFMLEVCPVKSSESLKVGDNYQATFWPLFFSFVTCDRIYYFCLGWRSKSLETNIQKFSLFHLWRARGEIPAITARFVHGICLWASKKSTQTIVIDGTWFRFVSSAGAVRRETAALHHGPGAASGCPAGSHPARWPFHQHTVHPHHAQHAPESVLLIIPRWTKGFFLSLSVSFFSCIWFFQILSACCSSLDIWRHFAHHLWKCVDFSPNLRTFSKRCWKQLMPHSQWEVSKTFQW